MLSCRHHWGSGDCNVVVGGGGEGQCVAAMLTVAVYPRRTSRPPRTPTSNWALIGCRQLSDLPPLVQQTVVPRKGGFGNRPEFSKIKHNYLCPEFALEVSYGGRLNKNEFVGMRWGVSEGQTIPFLSRGTTVHTRLPGLLSCTSFRLAFLGSKDQVHNLKM
jgi:hypothetical protein